MQPMRSFEISGLNYATVQIAHLPAFKATITCKQPQRSNLISSWPQLPTYPCACYLNDRGYFGSQWGHCTTASKVKSGLGFEISDLNCLHIHYVTAKLGLTLEGCHTQIRHLRDICIKWIWSLWALTIMSSKDFMLAFIEIEKFNFPKAAWKLERGQFLLDFSAKSGWIIVYYMSFWWVELDLSNDV